MSWTKVHKFKRSTNAAKRQEIMVAVSGYVLNTGDSGYHKSYCDGDELIVDVAIPPDLAAKCGKLSQLMEDGVTREVDGFVLRYESGGAVRIIDSAVGVVSTFFRNKNGVGLRTTNGNFITEKALRAANDMLAEIEAPIDPPPSRVAVDGFTVERYGEKVDVLENSVGGNPYRTVATFRGEDAGDGRRMLAATVGAKPTMIPGVSERIDISAGVMSVVISMLVDAGALPNAARVDQLNAATDDVCDAFRELRRIASFYANSKIDEALDVILEGFASDDATAGVRAISDDLRVRRR